MGAKRVSFKVAKAIKKAGYPLDTPITEVGWYNAAGIYTKTPPPIWEGDNLFEALAPTYLDVWLWLWREKGIVIDPDEVGNDWYIDSFMLPMETYPDPEEAIIAAIEYLVDNDLVK